MPATRKPPPGDEPAAIQEEEIPSIESRSRSPKFAKLETAIEGIYIMLGGSLVTLPMVNPRTKMIGMSLASSSSEIAEAWVDLAEEDKRVLRVLEQFTAFSGWGKVIGVHFIAVGAGAPGIAPHRPQQQQSQPQQPQAQTPNDLEQAMAVANMLRQMASEARVQEQPQQQQQPNGQQQQPPAQQPIPEGVQEQVRRQSGFRGGRGTGMPSPADLGVSISGGEEAFPASGSESVRG